jgi:hypothetical protein
MLFNHETLQFGSLIYQFMKQTSSRGGVIYIGEHGSLIYQFMKQTSSRGGVIYIGEQFQESS